MQRVCQQQFTLGSPEESGHDLDDAIDNEFIYCSLVSSFI